VRLDTHGYKVSGNSTVRPSGRARGVMRVAIFTDDDFDKLNGVTTTLKALLNHAPFDIQPPIYTASALGIDQPEYFAVRSLGVPIPYCPQMQMFLPPLGEWRRRLALDEVRLVHLTTPGPSGLAARYPSARAGLPLVGSFHTPLAEYVALLSGSARLGGLMNFYMRWLYGACERLLVPSEDTQRRLVSRGWSASRMSLWPHGVDTDVFSPARRSTALRERWGVSDRRPAILNAGRLSREKGLALMSPIGSLLYRSHVPHRFILAGDGPMSPELREACPGAVFLGRLSHGRVAVAMASADVLVLPGHTDAGGNVVLEAQATGLPVLVSSLGGPKEQMIDGCTGFHCGAADPQDFCSRATAILNDPGRRTAMGGAARAFAMTRTWEAAFLPLFTCYREAV
jgi:glycosyltransferase involved in cell wall biosynthesis